MNATIAIGNACEQRDGGGDRPGDDETQPAASSAEDTVDFVFQTARGTNQLAWQPR